MTKYTDEELMSILEDIDKLGYIKLSDWEINFIESIFNNGFKTDKQRNVVYKMMEKYNV